MLNGWKAIGAYLGREERTAMRWSIERGMPVHRAPGRGRGSVYALSEEIDAWLAEGRRQATAPAERADDRFAAAETSRPGASWWRRRRTAIVASVAGVVLLVGLGALLFLHRGATSPSGEPVFSDPGARASYLDATYDWNLRTRDSLARAVREYGQAIGRDPRVAASYVGLANSYLLLREFGSLPDTDAYPRAEAAAKAALDLTPGSAAAHRALGFIAFWWHQDRAAARREFQRAIVLNPDDPLTRHWYATALSANGEQAAALREINRAIDLDPGDASAVIDHALIDYLAGRHAEGVASLRRMEALQPDAVGPHRYLARIALWEGRASEYLDEEKAAEHLRGDADAEGSLERLRPLAGDRVALETVLLSRAETAAPPNGPWYPVAQIASLLGRQELATKALATACTTRERGALAAKADLWLSRSVDRAHIVRLCGGSSLE